MPQVTETRQICQEYTFLRWYVYPSLSFLWGSITVLVFTTISSREQWYHVNMCKIIILQHHNHNTLLPHPPNHTHKYQTKVKKKLWKIVDICTKQACNPPVSRSAERAICVHDTGTIYFPCMAMTRDPGGVSSRIEKFCELVGLPFYLIVTRIYILCLLCRKNMPVYQD